MISTAAPGLYSEGFAAMRWIPDSEHGLFASAFTTTRSVRISLLLEFLEE